MKLEKAIEIETIHNDHNPNFTDADRREAHQLSIEALIFRQRWEDQEGEDDFPLLPGETKD